MKPLKNKYNDLLITIGQTIKAARLSAVKAVNTELIKANWEIGRHIIEFEQHGQERAEYGSELLTKLAKDLKLRYGKGFGRRNVVDMRRFYLVYPKWQEVPAKLSWTHFVALLGVTNESARKFYEKQTSHENWSYRELERQINSSLFERLALSRDKKGVLQLSEKGNIAYHPEQAIKDRYVLDFLKIPQSNRVQIELLRDPQKIIFKVYIYMINNPKP